MHELGIAESALELALAQAHNAGAARVLRIVIRVGALSGVDAEALQFAFTAILPGTAAEGATVQIDPVAAIAYCPACQKDFSPTLITSSSAPPAASCAGPSSRVRELDLVRLEML